MNRTNSMVLFAAAVLAFLFLAGCVSPAPTVATPTPTPAPTPTLTAAGCTDKECFITAANECRELELTLTEEAGGVFTYSSSTGCVFTKTLVTLSAGEDQELKRLLEGKRLTCRYERGAFDPRWVTSLIFGTESCEGELKEALAQLLVFA